MTSSPGVKTTRRFKAIYLIITALFVLGSVGFAAAGLWVLALALLAMGGAMTGASRQMRVPGSHDAARAVSGR